MRATVERAGPVARAADAQSWRVQERLLMAGLLAVDTAGLVIAFMLAYWFRFDNPWLPYYATFSPQFYVSLLIWCVPLYLGIFAVHHLYDPHTLFGGTREYARVANSCTLGVVVVIIYGFLQRDASFTISRGWLLAAWLLSILVVGGARFAYRRLIYRLRQQGHLLSPALILGTNEEAKAVAEQLRANPGGGLQIIGFVGNRAEPGTMIVDGLHLLGHDADLPDLIQNLGVHEVIVAPTAVSRERLLDLHHKMQDFPEVHLRLSSGFFEILTTGVQVQDIGNVPLISMNRLRITGVDALLKGCMDYGLAIPGAILISPVLLIIAIAVKTTSPGPIIHRRRVMGREGRTFDAFKFRTMIVNADQVLAEMMDRDPELKREYESGQKLKHDPRVTPAGRILRKFSLDELPQVFNVLRGEMSLVGPRMICPGELKLYGVWGDNLLTVKPGITGPWQVMGRNDLSYDERVRLSMQYIRNYSIWTDLKILLDTFAIVIKGKGAY